MRIDQLIKKHKPKRSAPTNLQELYELEDNPDSEMYKELDRLYGTTETNKDK